MRWRRDRIDISEQKLKLIKSKITNTLSTVFRNRYTYISNTETEILLKYCTFLDPRFKASFFDADEKNRTVNNILCDGILMNNTSGTSDEPSNALKNENKKGKLAGLAAILCVNKNQEARELSKNKPFRER